MLVTENLVKQYGDITAVDDVSFSASAGQVFGLLGPNGAGKSTTINCISGLLSPTSGHVAVAGHDVVRDGKAARKSLGVVPQELALYEDLPAIDNLRYWGKAYGMRGSELEARVAEVLDTIGLADRARDLPKSYSGGMKRRLNFGCGIVHRPSVLLLDEPTVGVDPQSRSRLFDLVGQPFQAGPTRLEFGALRFERRLVLLMLVEQCLGLPGLGFQRLPRRIRALAQELFRGSHRRSRSSEARLQIRENISGLALRRFRIHDCLVGRRQCLLGRHGFVTGRRRRVFG